jgi:anthranilate phosphoribosyltransferase
MIEEILNKLSRKENLSNQEMQDVVNHIMCGEVEDNDIESFLIALNEKGIQEPEITAAATVMREKSLKFDIGDGTHIDTCGTGGTGLHTFNCSTCFIFCCCCWRSIDNKTWK